MSVRNLKARFESSNSNNDNAAAPLRAQMKPSSPLSARELTAKFEASSSPRNNYKPIPPRRKSLETANKPELPDRSNIPTVPNDVINAFRYEEKQEQQQEQPPPPVPQPPMPPPPQQPVLSPRQLPPPPQQQQQPPPHKVYARPLPARPPPRRPIMPVVEYDEGMNDNNNNNDDDGTPFRKLSSRFVRVSDQIESGLYMLKRMITFLRKIASHIDTFVSGVTKVTVHETGKEKTKNDRQLVYQSAWSSVQELLQTHASKHTQFRVQILEILLPPLQESYKSLELKRAGIMKDLKTIQMDTKSIINQVKSCKKTALKCLSNLRSGMNKDTSSQSTKTGVFSQLKDKLNDLRLEDVPQMRIKAETACRAYADALQRANEKKKRTNTDILPHIMDRLHEIEWKRLQAMKDCTLGFARAYQMITTPLAQLGEELLSNATPLNPLNDVNKYAEKHYEEEDDSSTNVSNRLKYDLPCTVDDLRRGRWKGDMTLKTHDSIYGASIEAIMKLQEKTYPNAQMPQVFIKCVERIIALNGANEEGIFRISAKKHDLDRVRKAFDSGNYDILEEYQSAHVPAGSLKQWLRELEEPLIPSNLYDSCVELSKNAEAKRESKLDERALSNVCRQLSNVRRAIINKLVEMFTTIVQNAEYNKMNISNLAIVFAPSFLRCDDDDPLLMMMNSKYETHFVSELLEYVFKYQRI